MLITPNQLRGQVSTVYYLIVNLLGLSIGPTATALLTDFVFRDEAALRYSLALAALFTGLFGLVTAAVGLRHYGAYAEQMRNESVQQRLSPINLNSTGSGGGRYRGEREWSGTGPDRVAPDPPWLGAQ